MGQKTVENYFSAISAFYDYLVFEELSQLNPVMPFRKWFLRNYKDEAEDPERRLLSVEQMSKLVNSILDSRDKAIAVVLAKTGIRRNELLSLDRSIGNRYWKCHLRHLDRHSLGYLNRVQEWLFDVQFGSLT